MDNMDYTMTMDDFEKEIYDGTFEISSNKKVPGKIEINGRQTFLKVWDEDYIQHGGLINISITGILSNLKKVSLIDCRTSGPTTWRNRESEAYYACFFYPSFVCFGDEHIYPDIENITEIRAVIDDAEKIFYDHTLFGYVNNNVRSLTKEAIKNSFHKDRNVEVGPYPFIAYYTGKSDIISANTNIGTISITNDPILSIAKMDNTIHINIKFNEPVTFDTSINQMRRIIKFLGIMAGRHQNIVRCTVHTDIEKDLDTQVYWSYRDKYERSDSEIGIGPLDILVSALDNPVEFSTILSRWIGRDIEDKKPKSWKNARTRLFTLFDNHRSDLYRLYMEDEIVSASNMFDLLPEDELENTQTDSTMSEELKNAIDKCKDIAEQDLANNRKERKILLESLYRLTHPSNAEKIPLKKKIKHRAKIIKNHVSDSNFLPDIEKVIDEAVNCRTYFVHGVDCGIDYYEELDLMFFLYITLEFIFAVSDLIESGWNMNSWLDRNLGASHHPFALYIKGYERNVQSCLTREKK